VRGQDIELRTRHCVPCEKGTPQLRSQEVRALLTDLDHWSLFDGRLVRELRRRNFRDVLDIVNQIGELAEKEGHHPDLRIHSWNRLTIELTTHAIGGLSENDFILAAHIDRLLEHSNPAPA